MTLSFALAKDLCVGVLEFLLDTLRPRLRRDELDLKDQIFAPDLIDARAELALHTLELLAPSLAEREREELRSSLLEQFNRILPTTDTPQGLKVNIADVLFATGKYDLQPATREALAKFSGIVIAHPGLRMAVGGYTDSVGGDTFNLTLSENRANAVKAYLINQGIDPGAITSSGYGKSHPEGDNSTAAGRQLNRRVEIMISGEIIGAQIGGAGGVGITPAPSNGVPRIH